MIVSDYRAFANLPIETSNIFAKDTKVRFYVQPTKGCSGGPYFSDDLTRATIAHPQPDTWVMGWKETNNSNFDDLVVRIDLVPSEFAYLDSPIVPVGTSSVNGASTKVADSLPPVDAFMDHKYPNSQAGDTAYPHAVTYWGADTIEPDQGTIPTYNGNDGTDFQLAPGTAVLAAASGSITYAGEVARFCPLHATTVTGKAVKIHHDNGYTTEYWGLYWIAPGTTAGQRVTHDSNKPLGISGMDPCSGNAGFHFVVRNPKGIAVDPFGWKPRPDSFWYEVDDPWQVFNAGKGLDAASYPLWTIAPRVQRLASPSVSTVLTLPSSLVTAIIPSGTFSNPLRLELSNSGDAGQREGFSNLRSFTLFGYARGDEPIIFLNKDVTFIVDLSNNSIPANASPNLYVWDLYSENGAIWRLLSSTWDAKTGHLQATSNMLGTFAVLIKLPHALYLPVITNSR